MYLIGRPGALKIVLIVAALNTVPARIFTANGFPARTCALRNALTPAASASFNVGAVTYGEVTGALTSPSQSKKSTARALTVPSPIDATVRAMAQRLPPKVFLDEAAWALQISTRLKNM